MGRVDATEHHAAKWLKEQIAYYWPRRHQDPGQMYQLRQVVGALRRLRTTGPWWGAMTDSHATQDRAAKRELIAQAIATYPMTRGEIAEYVNASPELVPEPKWPVTNGHRKAADRVIEALMDHMKGIDPKKIAKKCQLCRGTGTTQRAFEDPRPCRWCLGTGKDHRA
jgi:hypothetical protein